jgi:uncharacterized protein YxjI
MASQFCVGCGKPLPDDAQFCTSCGRAVQSNPAAPAPPSQGPPPPPSPEAMAQASKAFGSSLGLEGSRSFLLQHELVSGGRNYRVLNHEKRHLFSARENLGEELRANLLGGMGAPSIASGLGRFPPVTRTFPWTVLDAAGNVRGSIVIQMTGMTAVSMLTDSTGVPILTVQVARSTFGGLTASATYPDGRPMLEARGNLIHHNFSIHDASGREVAKIHEAFASIRDTYNLDLVGNVDPLYPLIFALLIDREKSK